MMVDFPSVRWVVRQPGLCACSLNIGTLSTPAKHVRKLACSPREVTISVAGARALLRGVTGHVKGA